MIWELCPHSHVSCVREVASDTSPLVTSLGGDVVGLSCRTGLLNAQLIEVLFRAGLLLVEFVEFSCRVDLLHGEFDELLCRG